MPYSDIIDNRNVKLKDEINAILNSSDGAKFAVGYLYLSGFYQIAEKLGELKEVKILTGNTLQKETIEELAQSLASEEELKETFEAGRIQRKSEREKIRDNIAEAITGNLQALPHTSDRERNIKSLSEFIINGKLKIKVYTKHPLHAKAYIFNYTKEASEATRSEGISIIGSSNLTISGFHHNTELNTFVRGHNNYEELNRWFDNLWDEAVPFEEVLINRFNESWALKTVNPYDIYILTLYHLVKSNLETQVSTIWNWEGMPQLYSFQKAAIMQAYQILNKYNGVFISDVVGLGKTFIGAGLLRHLNKRALIISPPGLIEMWREFKERFRIDAEVISRGMIYRGIYDNESILKRYESREVVLIDESHHFRSTKARRYQELQPFLADKQVILMTATPQNTSVMTIHNLIKVHSKFYKIIDEKGLIPAGEKAADAIYRHELEDVWDELEEITRDYRAEDFHIGKLKKDILLDIRLLEEIRGLLDTIPEDDDKKFDCLHDIITNIKKKRAEEKILIFSEYADTVNYIYERLKNNISNVDFVTSDTGSAIPEKAAYFAPIANNYSGPKKTDVLISTDVLSEGFNLQDCSIIINYDLHWNPVRLIQRAGRVDRIGSEADIIHIMNFLPVDKIEKEINLKRVLKQRIEEIHRYIGEDNKILDDSERINEDAMYCIYEKGDMEEVEKSRDIGFSYDEAESLIKQLEKDRPEYMALIRKMQLGLRSSKTMKSIDGTYGFFKAGDIAKLFIATGDGRVIDDFSQVIDEIRCENDCREIEADEAQKEKYFSDLDKLRTMFKEAIQTEKLKLKPHTEVLKTKKRLQTVVDLFSNEEVRENAEKLDRVLNEYFPHHLIPLLKRLNKGSYSDENYLNELIDIYNKERLGDVMNNIKRDVTKKQIEFICGEILL